MFIDSSKRTITIKNIIDNIFEYSCQLRNIAFLMISKIKQLRNLSKVVLSNYFLSGRRNIKAYYFF